VLAPLTRGGNLPYRRLCTELGAPVTFSEMAHSVLLLKKERREHALLRHHETERCFGVQLAAREPEKAVPAARMAVEAGARFIDLNLGCPIDSVVRRGEGAALLEKPRRLEKLFLALRAAIEVPLFAKIRTGYHEGKENAVAIAQIAEASGVDALTVHGRTREQRYRRPADWERVAEVARSVAIPVIGNGDILHATDALQRLRDSGCAAVMAARGALIKPWLWEGLAAGADRPRSSEERLAIYRRWASHALEAWGRDERGFRRVRGFLEFHVEWWSRYVPEDSEAHAANTMQSRTQFVPRDDLEALLAARGEDGVHPACDEILRGFDDAPPVAFRPSGDAIDPSAGGWT
jgi:tRNA-dihydrouridine synthase 3